LSIKIGIVAWAAGAVLAGSIAAASVVEQDPACPTGSQAAHTGTADAGHGHGHVMVGPTCNLVEMVGPEDSTYRPDVTRASRADRAQARSLLGGVNEFCRTHSAAEVMDTWVPGEGNARPSHFFNPDRAGSLGLDASDPRAVLIYRGQIGGVMFTGRPLPPLGSIPRAHTHDLSRRPREMLHVYCTTNLAEAFTPSRTLGVLADSIALRKRIRPLVAYLPEPGLTVVLDAVREYVGGALPHVDPRGITTPGPADPVLRAKREEIRQSLLLLSEPQLRRILSLIRGS
jgi:hypothetical protein